MEIKEGDLAMQKSMRTITASALGLLFAVSAHADDIYMTGHDILLHGGQRGYDEVILDFIRGAEQSTVLTERQADLDDFTDEELEALLDRSERIHQAGR